MKTHIIIFIAIFTFASCNSNNKTYLSTSQIEQLIESGEYTKAQQAIAQKIILDPSLSSNQKIELDFKKERLDRIKSDFTKNDSSVILYIKDIYPQVTSSEIAQWEKSGALEHKIIDGEKRYFHSAHRNLFRISKEAQEKQTKIKGRQSDSLDRFLAKFIPQLENFKGTNYSKNKFEHLILPQEFNITVTMTVKPNVVPDGEIIRVWLPFPRESAQYEDIKLISVSDHNFIMSPDKYSHKSIYMEGTAIKDSVTTFTYTASFKSYNRFFDFTAEDVKVYNKESATYKDYTKEENEHIIFTDDIKRITDSIISGIENPYLRSVKIYEYIASTYPWASAREYSTITNIPQYVIDNKHGDCGQVSLLYITMARYAGIPSKWQSGWMLHPGEVNLHDWAESYYEGIGWVPVDQSFGISPYYTKGLDAYRLIVNEDISSDFFPAKIHHRSETVDFQRGEVEWKGGNLYFDKWRTRLKINN